MNIMPQELIFQSIIQKIPSNSKSKIYKLIKIFPIPYGLNWFFNEVDYSQYLQSGIHESGQYFQTFQ